MEDHLLAKETIRKFNNLYLHYVQEEEKRTAEAKSIEASIASKSKVQKNSMKDGSRPVKKCKTSKSKAKQDNIVVVKRTSSRPDLKAMKEMISTKTVLYGKRRVGTIPGIEVGYQFFSRCEMVAVGFHHHWLNGIDYIAKSCSKEEEYQSYTLPLAVCIVMSGQYEDDVDDSNDVVYTGQGGHDGLRTKLQNGDQELVRGNLALKNNMLSGEPVRVVRGHSCAGSYSKKVYTYDGLYKVVDQWAEKGNSGYTVFRYRLSRLEGQPPLTTGQVIFTRSQAPKSVSELRGLVCEDISGERENFPIPATNVVDDPPFAPQGFEYSESLKVACNVKLPPNALGCKCEGHCVDPKICTCARLNGSDFPYVSKDGGRLIEAKSVIFECGPDCACDAKCLNQTSQQGLKYRLEVFRTPGKGWGVRSWDTIPPGAPICEYTGILSRTCDIENAANKNNNFIFDIDSLKTINDLNGRKQCGADTSAFLNANTDEIDSPEYCIDAGTVGNVARFINHSCEPNLFVQCILSSHLDIRMSRVVLFAADVIPPLQELTYDYGYALDSVTGPDGQIVEMPCYCGAVTCRKRLY